MVYFTNIQDEIILRIREAKTSLKIAVAWFNNQNLFDEVLQKLTSGCKVDLIVINDKINNSGLDFQEFINNEGGFYFSNETPGLPGVVHHKFCIIDNNLVISGSYNWTNKANLYNRENIAIFSEEESVKKFCDEFETIRALYGPKIIDLSTIKNMNYYFEDEPVVKAFPQEPPISEINIKNYNVSSAEILIKINDIIKLKECRSSWNKFHKNPCEILISPWDNEPAAFSAGEDIPQGGLKYTARFYTLTENLTQLSIYVIKNTKKRRVANFENLTKQPVGATVLEIQLTLDQLGNLKVECKEIEGNQSAQITIKEVFSESKFRITQN